MSLFEFIVGMIGVLLALLIVLTLVFGTAVRFLPGAVLG